MWVIVDAVFDTGQKLIFFTDGLFLPILRELELCSSLPILLIFDLLRRERKRG